MAPNEDTYETPKWRTLWLGVGFTVLIGVGVVTVLLPELEDEPSEESATSQDDVASYGESAKAPPE